MHGVSLEVPEAQIVTVLGANGAGKSTTIRTITGLLPASGGSIEFDGQEIRALSTDRIVHLGISVVPEGRQLFGEMTVLENLRLGAYTRGKGEQVHRQMERVISYFPVLGDRLAQLSHLLSGGEQQILAIGRALMARPSLLILDEPSLGVGSHPGRGAVRQNQKPQRRGGDHCFVGGAEREPGAEDRPLRICPGDR